MGAVDLLKRPLPRNMSALPCDCSPNAKRGEACTAGGWIRCNVRLLALRKWQWNEEERLGEPHPEGVPNPHAPPGAQTKPEETR